MALSQNLWSVSALSVEFGLDRRTVGQRLNNVEPAQVKGKVKKYKLQDAGNFRAKLWARPAKSAPDIFASSNVKEAKALLRKSINDVLEELSDSMIEVYDLEDTEFTGGKKDDKKHT